MAHVADHVDFRALQRERAAARPSIWRKMFDAVWYAQQRRAQIDIERTVAWRDGRINDQFEREIEQRMFGEGWNFRR